MGKLCYRIRQLWIYVLYLRKFLAEIILFSLIILFRKVLTTPNFCLLKIMFARIIVIQHIAAE